jgi:hypothetical protein
VEPAYAIVVYSMQLSMSRTIAFAQPTHACASRWFKPGIARLSRHLTITAVSQTDVEMDGVAGRPVFAVPSLPAATVKRKVGMFLGYEGTAYRGERQLCMQLEKTCSMLLLS